MLVTHTSIFEDWLSKLKDKNVRNRIDVRIKMLETDNYFGDHKSVGNGVFEMRIHFGSGYRLYYAYRGDVLVLLLCGGNKSTQQKDIEKAKELNKKEVIYG